LKLYRLTDLKLDEVSFVTKGANPLAKIVISKRHLEPEEEENMAENTFSFSKSMPNHDLVRKCLHAVKTMDYSNVTRQDFDDALDSVAEAVSKEHDISFADAYQAVTEGEQGGALYQAREAVPATGFGSTVQKAQVISKSALIEKDAVYLNTAYGVDINEAREQVRAFYEAQG
jgi:hypothetical protein